MSEYTPQVGHRVRVTTTFTGVVDGVRRDGTFSLRLDDGDILRSSDRHDEQTIERLPDPEPEWQPGDVVTDSVGDTCAYIPDREWPDPWVLLHRGDSRALVSTPGIRFPDEDMTRPLTPLLRRGKPWAEAVGAA